jgi:hypothetical protein
MTCVKWVYTHKKEGKGWKIVYVKYGIIMRNTLLKLGN